MLTHPARPAGSRGRTEKPLSDQLTGVPELIAKRDATGLVVMVALCFRFHAGAVRMRELLRAGEIGRLVSVRYECLPFSSPTCSVHCPPSTLCSKTAKR